MSRDARTGELRTVTVSALASQGRRQSQLLAPSPPASPGYYGGGNTGWNNAYAAQADPHFGKPYYPVRAYAGMSPYYGYSGWEDYSGRNFLKCVPGTMTKLDDGQMYRCQ